MRKKLSKLISFLLALSMVIGILPTMAYAEETGKKVFNEIYITTNDSAWTLYQVGKDAKAAERQFFYEVMGVGEAYKDMYRINTGNSSLRYIDGTGYNVTKDGDVIEEGRHYIYRICVQSKDNYGFDSNKDNMTVYLNGTKVKPVYMQYREYWGAYVIEIDVPYSPAARPEMIEIKYFSLDIGEVRIGQTSATSIENNNETFKISKLEWTCDKEPEFKAGDVFKEDSTYTLALTLTPNKGYAFSVDEATNKYNGTYSSRNTNYDSRNDRMDGSNLILKYTFKTVTTIKDIYLKTDYSAWSKYKIGANGGEASAQFSNKVSGVEQNDMYYLDTGNTCLAYIKYEDDIWAVTDDDVISQGIQYVMCFNLYGKKGYSFDNNASNMNVYLNGTKVTPRELYYNEYCGSYRVFIDVPFNPAEETVLTGWQKADGKWYYYDKTGVKQFSKWIGGNYYVKADGTMAISEFVDKGNYYVGKDGKWDKGTKWLKSGDKWYYIVSGKVQKSKWMQIGKKWYHFNKDGIMEKSKWIGGNYYVKADGTMAISEFVDKGNYYVGKDGKWDKGTKWLKSGDKWYYIVSGKVQKSKWVQISKKWYHFDKDGIMETSKWIDGKYYVKADGTMAISEWVDAGKYYVGADGKWIKGYKK